MNDGLDVLCVIWGPEPKLDLEMESALRLTAPWCKNKLLFGCANELSGGYYFSNSNCEIECSIKWVHFIPLFDIN